MERIIKNIVLVGFMGSGKTAIGRRVASLLHWDFQDTDTLIEKGANRTISEIFEQKGEPYFRDLETKTLQKLLGTEKQVISTGGGIVLREKNWGLLRKLGPVIALEASPQTVFRRVGRKKHRPLLRSKDRFQQIESMMRERAPFYAKADFTISTDQKSTPQVAREIVQRLGIESALSSPCKRGPEGPG